MKKVVEKLQYLFFLSSVLITVPSYIVWITSVQNTIVQLR
jgi:hypothetical protein